MFEIYLQEPHALTFSLKPTSERLLGMKPSERDAVKEWVLEHVPEAKKKPSEWGAYIWRAPGKLVGTYANGDVTRTERLHKFLMPKLEKAGMIEAYDRERELMPILMDSEREGIRCNVDKLRRDIKYYDDILEICDGWLRLKLKVPWLNLDQDRDVADALHEAGVVTDWVHTPVKMRVLKSGVVKVTGGVRSVAKANMGLEKFADPKVAAVYGYRTRLATCLRMFMYSWLRMAEASGGLIYTRWNQVRQGGFDSVGARTGRLSSSPNFQNVPTAWLDKGDHYAHPNFLLFGFKLRPLPDMRGYFLPDPGEVWIKRDYSQQEIRLLAHFEDGSLLRKYQDNPDYDLHEDVRQAIKEHAGLDLKRGPVKILNFGDIYGMGFKSFHAKTGISEPDYKKICAAKKVLLPDLAELDQEIKQRGKQKLPIRTWGGRVYFCEEPHFVKAHGRHMTFEYKLLNYLIQGSAADVTKQAVINYHNHPDRKARFILTVHDEINASSPANRVKEEQKILGECMGDIKTSLFMKSDPVQGPTWGSVKK
jgi:DNA polymerase I-like protein with 3'-5' exonuclease and polymerase domains